MIQVARERLFARLGHDRRRPPGPGTVARCAAAADWYARHGRPWSGRRWLPVTCAAATVTLDPPGGPVLRSPVLAAGLAAAGVRRVALIAASAGAEVDRAIAEHFAAGRPDDGYFLAVYAELIATTLRDRLATGHHPHLLPAYAPGYAGWELADLPALVERLGAAAGPVRLADQGGLRPQRSTVVLAGQPTRAVTDPHRYWDRYGGRTCPEDCRPCVCSPR